MWCAAVQSLTKCRVLCTQKLDWRNITVGQHSTRTSNILKSSKETQQWRKQGRKMLCRIVFSRCQLFQSSTPVWDQPYVHSSCFQRLAEAVTPCPPRPASSTVSLSPSFALTPVQTILRKVSPHVRWEAEIQNGKFQPKWLKSSKVTMDKQEGRAMVRTARCHLRSRAPAEPETCPAPNSLGSRGKRKQEDFVWVVVLPWIPLPVTIWKYMRVYIYINSCSYLV